MKKTLCLLVVASVFSSCQKLIDYFPNPNESLPQFNAVFGGSDYDRFLCIAAQKDDGYVLAGETNSKDGTMADNTNGYHGLILKLDKSGHAVWQKFLNGEVNWVTATHDGGYILAGAGGDAVSTENHGSTDAWIVKLDATGAVSWQREFGGTRRDKANAVIESGDGGYIVAASLGRADSLTYYDVYDAWLFKLDGEGNLVWQTVIGGGKGIEADEAISVTKGTNGSYVFTGPHYRGATDSTDGNMDILAVKVDAEGHQVWRQTFGTADKQEEPVSVINSSSGYVIAGNRASSFGGNDAAALVLKIDEDGTAMWQKTYGGSKRDFVNKIAATADGGFVMAGSTAGSGGDVSGNHGRSDAWVAKLNSGGNVSWQKTLGGSGFENAYAIVPRSDGSYVIAGSASSTDGDVPENYGNQDAWVTTVKAK